MKRNAASGLFTKPSLFLPEFGDQQHQHRVDLQASDQHAEGEDPFAHGGRLGVGGRRVEESQSGADISQGRGHGREGRDHVESEGGHGERRHDRDAEVEDEESQDAFHHIDGDGLISQLDQGDGMGMDETVKLLVAPLEDQHDPDAFDGAAGGAGRAADEHQDQEDDLGEGGPLGEVVRDESGRRDDRGDLEDRQAEGFGEIRHDVEAEVQRDQERGHADRSQKETRLAVLVEGPEVAHQELVMEGEVHPGDDHEDDQHAVDVSAVEPGDARVPRGESPGRHRAEDVVDGVEDAHAAEEEEDETRNRDDDVDQPEGAGRLRDPRLQLVLDRPRDLRPEELPPSHPEKGEDGDGEDDDPHPAQPLGHGAPEEDPVGEDLDLGDDRGPGRREAGHRFEVGVRKGGESAVDHVGEPPEKGGENPSGRDDQEALPVAQEGFFLSGPEGEAEGAPGSRGDRHGEQEAPEVGLPVEQGAG